MSLMKMSSLTLIALTCCLFAGVHAQNFKVINLTNPFLSNSQGYIQGNLRSSRFTSMVATCGGSLSVGSSAAALVDVTSDKNATWIDLSDCGAYNGACQFEFGDDGTLDVPAVFSHQCDGHLISYSIEDGSILWQKTHYTERGWPVFYNEGKVYYFISLYNGGDTDGDLVCVDAATGNTLWTVPGTNGKQTPFLAGDDILVFAMIGGGAGGFSLSQNKTVWTRPDLSPLFHSGMDAHKSMFFGDHLYVRGKSSSSSSNNESMHKIKPSTGVDVWAVHNLVAPSPSPTWDGSGLSQVTFAVQTYEVFVYNATNVVDIGSNGGVDFVTKRDPKHAMGILAGKKASQGCLFSMSHGAALDVYSTADGTFIDEVKLPIGETIMMGIQQGYKRAVFAVDMGTIVTMDLSWCPTAPSSRARK